MSPLSLKSTSRRSASTLPPNTPEDVDVDDEMIDGDGDTGADAAAADSGDSTELPGDTEADDVSPGE